MGGTYQTMNKIIPGAYINFKAVPQPLMKVGDRGIATTAFECNWGKEGELVSLMSTDMFDGTFQKKFGDTDRLVPELILSNAYKVLVYRLNTGGVKATVPVGTNLVATAKYSGTFGNKLRVSVVAKDDKFEVTTYIETVPVDVQVGATAEDIKSNEYVTFSGTGVLTITAAVQLIGGTNGLTSASTAYEAYFKLLKTAKFQTLAITNNHDTANPLANAFVLSMREDNGKKIQVVTKSTTDDYEGLIKTKQGYKTALSTITEDMFPAWVAGATAGCPINESLTAKVIDGATSIIGEETREEIIEDLQNGFFLISATSDGGVMVVKDINSLHTFTPNKGYDFSKNRVIRVLDEIAMTVSSTFEKSYMGKVSNTEQYRNVFKSDLISYINSLTNMDAVQEFDSATDIRIRVGSALDEIIVDADIMPVDSMEKLYMTVNVRGAN